MRDRPPEVSQVVEHLFRHESAKMVATLTRIFGIEHLGLAEDVVQEAYVRAYTNLHQFAGESQFSTWLTKIAIHECFARSKRSRLVTVTERAPLEKHGFEMRSKSNPEEEMTLRELRTVLESVIETVPPVPLKSKPSTVSAELIPTL